MPLPNWLPELFEVNPWTDATFGRLYEIFVRDFKGVNLRLDGVPVRYFADLDTDGKELIFWYLVSKEDASEGDRLPDFSRCARLPWVAAVISNSNQPEVTKWDFREAKGYVNTYFWLKEFDFVVILRKFKNGSCRLITAFCVEGNGTKRTLESKFQRREKPADETPV
ncbi:MAG: hypothetical protein ABSB50_03370 [Terracidiphilus sp.]|jgi:hypothetical protein